MLTYKPALLAFLSSGIYKVEGGRSRALYLPLKEKLQ